MGNSDSHDIRQLGRTYSLVFAERSADAICHAIRQGLVSVQTTPVQVMELAGVLTGMFRRGNKAPSAADADSLREKNRQLPTPQLPTPKGIPS